MNLPRIQNPIRGFAVIVVAVISAYIMYMGYRLVDILSAPDWCARAINAEKLAESRATSAVDLCKDLLLKQVGSLATNSHIYAGVVALCLLTLIVIVIAGGKLSLSASKSGVNANIGKDADHAAQHVADEAQVAADEVKLTPSKPDDPRIPDYAKP